MSCAHRPTGWGFLLLHPRDGPNRTGGLYYPNWLMQSLACERGLGPEFEEMVRWRGDIIVMRCRVEWGKIREIRPFDKVALEELICAIMKKHVVPFYDAEKEINKFYL